MKNINEFRVWNGIEMEYNIMVGKFGVFYVNPSNNGIDEKDSASLSSFNTKYPDNTPVMQFTGQFDKKGKKIWVGDINQDGGVVIFNEDDSSFSWEYKGVEVQAMSNEEDWCEVIGDIYKTPYLAKS